MKEHGKNQREGSTKRKTVNPQPDDSKAATPKRPDDAWLVKFADTVFGLDQQMAMFHQDFPRFHDEMIARLQEARSVPEKQDALARLPKVIQVFFWLSDGMAEAGLRTDWVKTCAYIIVQSQVDELQKAIQKINQWELKDILNTAQAWISRFDMFHNPLRKPWDALKFYRVNLTAGHAAATEVLVSLIPEGNRDDRAAVRAFCEWLYQQKAGSLTAAPVPSEHSKGSDITQALIAGIYITLSSSPSNRADSKDVCGRFVVAVRGKLVKFPNVDGEQEAFRITGSKQWEDIDKLVTADGKFVTMETGFRQRWQKSDARKLFEIAFESTGRRGRGGKGQYRLKK